MSVRPQKVFPKATQEESTVSPTRD